MKLQLKELLIATAATATLASGIAPAPKWRYLQWRTACHAKAHCMRLIVIFLLANHYNPARLLAVPDYD